jgi:hypothetical protein
VAVIPLPAFRGSKRVTVTDVTAGIATPRTSGEVPFFLQASASDTVATGSSHPYRDGEFRWMLEKSDGGGGWDAMPTYRNQVSPVTGDAVNPYTDTVGGEFVAPIDSPGTYRLTLTARFYDGAGGYISDTETETYTITAFGEDANGHGSNHLYYDSIAGDDANDGKDGWGLSVTGASYNASTGALIKVGGFTNYDHSAATSGVDTRRHYPYVYLSSGFEAGVQPEVWLKDLNDETSVPAVWVDASGNGRDATVFGTPTLSTLNGNKGLFCENGGLIIDDFLTADEMTLVSVFRSGNYRSMFTKCVGQGASAVTFYISGGGGTNIDIRVSQSGTATPDKNYRYAGFDQTTNILVIQFDGTDLKFWLNGELQTPSVLNSDEAMTGLYDSDASLCISGYTSDETTPVNQNGQYSYEFMFFNVALSDAYRQRIEGHLAYRWDLQSKLDALHPYKTATDTSIFIGKLAKVASKTSNDEIVLKDSFWPVNLSEITTSSGPIQTFDGSVASGVRARLKAGSTGSQTVSTGSSSRLDCYGPGSRPALTVSGSAFSINNGSPGGPSDKIDAVLSEIDLQTAIGYTGDLALVAVSGSTNSTSGKIEYLFFDDCNAEDLSDGESAAGRNTVSISGGGLSSFSGEKAINKVGWWGGNITSTTDPCEVRTGFYASCGDWGFICWTYFEGYGENNILDHHIYANFRDHSCYYGIEFGPGPNRSYCFNLNWESTETYGPSRFVWVGDCDMENTDNAFDAANGDPADGNDYFENVVLDACSLHDLSGIAIVYPGRAKTITFRDLYCWGNDGTNALFRPFIGTNSVWTGHEVTFERVNIYTAQDDSIIPVNLTSDFATEFIDCNIVDLQLAARTIITSVSTAAYTRNNLYAPNDTDGDIMTDNSVAKTLAEYIADLDAAGSGADPGWNDPANGDFSIGGSESMIDTKEKRASCLGVGRPWYRTKLPGTNDGPWRAASGNSYAYDYSSGGPTPAPGGGSSSGLVSSVARSVAQPVARGVAG